MVDVVCFSEVPEPTASRELDDPCDECSTAAAQGGTVMPSPGGMVLSVRGLPTGVRKGEVLADISISTKTWRSNS
jgi:hypothetical protein